MLGWIRNGEQLQVHYPGLNETQVDVMGIATGHLPSYNGERMQIAIPAGASDEQIAEELMVSLGSLFTREDMAAFLANLPQERNEPLLVDIYELYQEILARYQTRLHSDERVWEAEIPVNQAADALAEHNATYGEYLHCTGEFATEDPAICRTRIELEERLDDVLRNIGTVRNIGTYMDAR